MCKKFFSLLMLCVIANVSFAEDVQMDNSVKAEVTEKQNNSEVKVVTNENTVALKFVKSTEFEKLVELLSSDAKAELESLIEKSKKLITDNSDLTAFIQKHNGLYNQFKTFKGSEPIVCLILSIEGENAFDFIAPEFVTSFGDFVKTLSEESLNELNIASVECEELMFAKAEAILPDLETSKLNKELDEKSGNKNFSATFIVA